MYSAGVAVLKSYCGLKAALLCSIPPVLSSAIDGGFAVLD
jgi:hypothetical protein